MGGHACWLSGLGAGWSIDFFAVLASESGGGVLWEEEEMMLVFNQACV